MLKQLNKFLDTKDKFIVLRLIFLIFIENIIETLALICIPMLVLIIQGKNFFKEFINNNEFLKTINISIENITFDEITNYFLIIFFFLISLRFVLKIFNQRILSNFVKNLIVEKSSFFFKNFFNTKYDLIQKYKVSEIQITIEQIELIARAILQFLQIIKEVVIILLIFITIFFKSWLVGLVVIFFLFFSSSIFLLLIKKKITSLSLLTRDFREKYISKIIESISAIKEIYLYKKANLINKDFYNATFDIANNKLDTEFYSQIIKPALEFIALSMILAFVFISTNAKEVVNQNNIPFLSFLIICAVRLLPSFSVVSQNIVNMKSISKVTRKTFEIINFFNNLNINNKSSEFKKLYFQKSIKLINCYYKFHNSKLQNLKNISLEIKKGEKIGIFGDTGSGKSTLISLLVGLLKPTRGKVYLDNKIVQHDSIINSGFVQQTPFLFNDTLQKNIILEDNVDREKLTRLKKIIQICQLKKFTELRKNKINFIIEDFGKNLSGGERQRISIARALFASEDFLILDEATTGLDKKTELKLFNSIKKNYPNITIILITHEKENLKYFKKIIVLEKGKIKKICNYNNLKKS